jgi:hypothetical protein
LFAGAGGGGGVVFASAGRLAVMQSINAVANVATRALCMDASPSYRKINDVYRAVILQFGESLAIYRCGSRN